MMDTVSHNYSIAKAGEGGAHTIDKCARKQSCASAHGPVEFAAACRDLVRLDSTERVNAFKPAPRHPSWICAVPCTANALQRKGYLLDRAVPSNGCPWSNHAERPHRLPCCGGL